MSKTWHTDVIIVGGGLAGLSAARACAGSGLELNVTLICNAPAGLGGSSAMAQGGVAVAISEDDTPDLHLDDTLRTGAGLCDPLRVDMLVREGSERMYELFEMGVPFDRTDDGLLLLGREAAHSRDRIVHSGGDKTGAAILSTVFAHTADHNPRITWTPGTVVDLVVTPTETDRRAVGVVIVDEDGDLRALLAPTIILATGGSGQLYRWTTNPREARGDGLAIAARAGVRLADLEFVQFHPTALAGTDESCDAPVPLLSEAIRGAGAWLVDETGARIMDGVHPDLELGPRDIVARTVWATRRAGHQVFLDISPITGDFHERFPAASAACAEFGIDPAAGIPVTPAAHYHMGGVAVSATSATSLPGLWACGELACTGVHGANRLASNSLLEALVFGARAGHDVWTQHRELQFPPPTSAELAEAQFTIGRWTTTQTADAPNAADLAVLTEIRDLMWDHVGLVRTAAGMALALRTLDELAARPHTTTPTAWNALLVARLITTASLRRQESRGAHYRQDFPESSQEWNRRQFFESEWLLAELQSPVCA